MLATAAVGLTRSRKGLQVDFQTASVRQESRYGLGKLYEPLRIQHPARRSHVSHVLTQKQMVRLAGASRYECRSRLGVQSNSVLIPKKMCFEAES